MRLVYFSPLPWVSFTQRPHELVRYFHSLEGRQVLWVEPYPTRLPALKDLFRPEVIHIKHAIELPEWLKVLTPRALPLEPLPGGTHFNRALFWGCLIHQLEQFASGERVIIGVGKPSALACWVLDHFRGVNSFYDAMDDFPAFYRGISRQSMERCEHALLQRVAQVFVSSTRLIEKMTDYGIKATQINNACDASILPEPIAKKPVRPEVAGYVGTVGQWFDWELVTVTAEASPDLTFKIIGPVFSPPPKFLPANIHLVSSCPHQEALRQMQSFSVGLIPFKLNRLTASVDPIKYYEYRAMGLPVVSTPFGEMAQRNDRGTYFVSRKEDSAAVVHTALRHKDDPGFISRFRFENSWKTRFETAGLFTTL